MVEYGLPSPFALKIGIMALFLILGVMITYTIVHKD